MRKIIQRTLVIVALLMAVIALTGNNHLYLGLYDTYLQGRTKPALKDPNLFPTRVIKSDQARPWPKAVAYNKIPISEKVTLAHQELTTLGFLVIKKDSLLLEQYLHGHHEKAISNSFSMAKTILSVLTGCALKEGKIRLNDPVHKYLPDYIQKKDSALQVKHLLNMTSGMNFDEDYSNPIGFMAKAYYGNNLASLLKGYQLTHQPGTRWEYLGGNNLLLSFLLEKALGQSISSYAQEKLWQPLGMEQNAQWILDHKQGHEKTFSGFYATARDFAKIGQLFMHYGQHKGEQLVDIAYVQASTLAVKVNDKHGTPTYHYGYAWWLTEYQGLEVFYMRGILGQYVLCIPEKDIIIVRVGKRRMEKSNGINPDDLYIWLEEGLRIASNN